MEKNIEIDELLEIIKIKGASDPVKLIFTKAVDLTLKKMSNPEFFSASLQEELKGENEFN